MIFQNRIDAAKNLAKNLEWLKKDNPVILAIPRGGVVIGDVISTSLNAKLDIIISKKVSAPHNAELAIGAVMPDGSYLPNEEITRMLNVPQKYVDEEITIQMKEIERRLINFRGNESYDLEDKTIVLVDDGVATGATIFASILWIRKHNPKKLIIAIPVGPKEIIEKLAKIVDKVVVLHCALDFNAVGEFYSEFDQVDDYQVQEIMSKHGYKIKLME